MIRSICSAFLCLFSISLPTVADAQTPAGAQTRNADEKTDRPRLRDLGISIGVLPTGAENSITDVEGVRVGHQTLVNGDAIRTGVTAVKHHSGNVFLHKVPAAIHVANGFGKIVGTTQINELGVIETPIILTNTLSTFAAADALVGWSLQQPGCETVRSVNPIVGECNDGFLNDIRQRRVSAKDVVQALEEAHGGPVEEGCVGAGTGVRCMGWKGGIGSSSRKLPASLGGFMVGVLVQTNFGGSLTVSGAPVGRELGRYYLKDEIKTQEHGSCIVVVATDAPLDSRRLQRLARRAPLGLAAAGSPISHGSGDYVIAFSTAKSLRLPYESDATREQTELLRDDRMSPLFQAVRDATEEAVINSMLQAVTTKGYQGRVVDAIRPELVAEICQRHGVGTVEAGRSGGDDQSSRLRSAPRTYGPAPLTASLRRRIDRFEDRLPRLMNSNHVPGVSLALIEKGQLDWTRGYCVRWSGKQHRG
ncbi:MAG: P1 family peptidase [Rubripirellula sp.]